MTHTPLLSTFNATLNVSLRHVIGAVVAAGIGLSVMSPSHAFFGLGGGGVNSATETTQLLNNMELVLQYEKQVQAYAQQVKDYTVQLNQWKATVQNLTNLPANVYNQAMAPYNTVMNANQNFLNGVQGLKSSVTNFDNTYKAKLAAAGKSGISGAEYMALEAKLARDKGGIYKTQVDNDIKQIEDLKGRIKGVQDLAAKIPALEGNQESLGLLNQQTNMVLTNLEEMRGVMLRESSEKSAAKSDALAANAVAIEAERLRQVEIEKAKQALNGMKVQGVGAMFIRKSN
jgi:type IV secretion system protein TrbJ